MIRVLRKFSFYVVPLAIDSLKNLILVITIKNFIILNFDYIPIGSTAIIFSFQETLVLNVTFLMGLFHLKFCRRFKMGPVRPCSDENQIIRQRPRRHNQSVCYRPCRCPVSPDQSQQTRLSPRDQLQFTQFFNRSDSVI